MSTQIKKETVLNSEDIMFKVSTIMTFSGGGEDYRAPFSPFSDSDYADETPWPFETMVFELPRGTPRHHQAWASLTEAKMGHAKIVKGIKTGTMIFYGVSGPFNTPSLTAEQWNQETEKAKS